MALSVSSIFVVLALLAYGGAPVALVWGWVRWLEQPNRTTLMAILSLLGHFLASASALLAIMSVAYAQLTGGFAFHDPQLMKIYRIGFLLSMSGLIFGLAGLGQSNPLRWHAPIGALGTFAFWLLAAMSE
jgi:hypothetical protein